MTACNGGWSGVCEGFAAGLFSAVEINAISPYPEGVAYFNVSRPANETTPEIEIAAEYNEHETSSPPTGCRIAEYAYGFRHFRNGPTPTVFCTQTEVEGNEEGEGEGDEGEGTAFDSYVVTTVWPDG